MCYLCVSPVVLSLTQGCTRACASAPEPGARERVAIEKTGIELPSLTQGCTWTSCASAPEPRSPKGAAGPELMHGISMGIAALLNVGGLHKEEAPSYVLPVCIMLNVSAQPTHPWDYVRRVGLGQGRGTASGMRYATTRGK